MISCCKRRKWGGHHKVYHPLIDYLALLANATTRLGVSLT